MQRDSLDAGFLHEEVVVDHVFRAHVVRFDDVVQLLNVDQLAILLAEQDLQQATAREAANA